MITYFFQQNLTATLKRRFLFNVCSLYCVLKNDFLVFPPNFSWRTVANQKISLGLTIWMRIYHVGRGSLNCSGLSILDNICLNSFYSFFYAIQRCFPIFLSVLTCIIKYLLLFFLGYDKMYLEKISLGLFNFAPVRDIPLILLAWNLLACVNCSESFSPFPHAIPTFSPYPRHS